jgi:hypothetical protein
MVAHNFQRQFAAMIIAGTKRSTIRPNGKRRHAFIGEQLQLYTGMRTKSCTLLMRVPCAAAAPVEIHWDHVIVDGARMEGSQNLMRLARIDGFADFGAMRAWFERQYGLPATQMTQIRWLPDRAVFRATRADIAELAT